MHTHTLTHSHTHTLTHSHTRSCFFLIIFGVIAKISAIINTIPYSVLGGMTTFLFVNIVVSGIGIIGPELHVRRSRFIVAASLTFGIGVALVPQWADNDLVRASGNKDYQFMGRAVVILLNTPYCIGTIVGACFIPPSLIASRLALHRQEHHNHSYLPTTFPLHTPFCRGSPRESYRTRACMHARTYTHTHSLSRSPSLVLVSLSPSPFLARARALSHGVVGIAAMFLHAIIPFDEDESVEEEEAAAAAASAKAKALDDINGPSVSLPARLACCRFASLRET